MHVLSVHQTPATFTYFVSFSWWSKQNKGTFAVQAKPVQNWQILHPTFYPCISSPRKLEKRKHVVREDLRGVGDAGVGGRAEHIRLRLAVPFPNPSSH